MKQKYTNNYRRNLELYWRQYFPDYTIPVGYHVHHIKPRCTFDESDLCVHHPRNLIALHPDDHVSIHKCRGDKWVNGGALLTVAGRKMTADTKLKISVAKKGIFNSNGHLGLQHSEETKNKMKDSAKNRPPVSQETKQKLSDINKGKIVTEQTKQKISNTLNGRPGSRLGVTNSAEHNAKISAGCKGKAKSSKGKKMSAENKRIRSMAAKKYWSKQHA